ncbi:hypothetical protein FRAHR75_2060001 [Frankia sp. Hr75.2]|nr:hypothetical protein FRAHR75_2060001 [Frankia sp. Hr75.2]
MPTGRLAGARISGFSSGSDTAHASFFPAELVLPGYGRLTQPGQVPGILLVSHIRPIFGGCYVAPNTHRHPARRRAPPDDGHMGKLYPTTWCAGTYRHGEQTGPTPKTGCR